MARRHKYAGATASITTKLDSTRIAELCESVAKHSETLQTSIRLDESTPDRLQYSARNRVTGGLFVFMKFEVKVSDVNGLRSVKTRILSYKQKRQWILVIPTPWQMLAWKVYKDFMYSLVADIASADPEAKSTVVELVA